MCPQVAQWTFRPTPRRESRRLTWFQSWLLSRSKRFVCAVAARRSGKTVGVRARILKRCIETPHCLVGYCAPTRSQAKRLIWRPLMADFAEPAARQFLRRNGINQSDLTIDFANGARLCVYGAERPEQIRGEGFDEFVVDEADDPNFDGAFFDEIVGPALSDQLGTLVQIGSPKGRGRLYREFRKGDSATPDDERDAEYETLQVTAVDAGIIARSEIERARATRPKRAFAQEYEAHFNAPLGIVYDEWNDSVHVVPQVPRREQFEQVIACVDWGTANRGTILILGIDSVLMPETEEYEAARLARAWVVDEESHAGMGYDDGGWWRLARELDQRWTPSIWYADPAGGQEGYLRQLNNALSDGAHRAPRVLPADNQVNPGIAAVQEFLRIDESLRAPQRFFVHERCKWLRGEFGDYRWRPHATLEDEFVDEPVKLNDHSLDALRYGIFTHFYKPYGRGRSDKLSNG